MMSQKVIDELLRRRREQQERDAQTAAITQQSLALGRPRIGPDIEARSAPLMPMPEIAPSSGGAEAAGQILVTGFAA
jgi:hypothetical protein